MNIRLLTKYYAKLIATASLLFFSQFSQGALSDLSSAPLVTSASSSVKPNLLFILDDSGSMNWSYLPDWMSDNNPFTSTSYTSITELYRNAGVNTIYYNPAITYSPPTYYNSDGTANTSTYPSMTSANTSAWTSVKNDGYGIQDTGTSNLVGDAYFYTFISGEYCAGENLRSCNIQTTASATYPYPAGLRWCTSSALTTCQALWYNSTNEYPRYPKSAKATISISGSSSSNVTSILVATKQILSSVTSASTDSRVVAQGIVDSINACTNATTGLCTVAGYSASRSSSTVTITAPAGTGIVTDTPVIVKVGTMTMTATAFSGGVPGRNLRTDIVSSTSSYPYPNTISKATSRTDCAGTTCTYAEEMTNYANWHAYYRTRMQMMKTAASIAFSPLNSNYRVGYASINNNTGTDFLNLADFSNSAKHAWDNKLFAAETGNSTPLRVSLATAGRFYAGKLSTYNTVTASDPIQYSCQQNFSLLSTDGYWNGGTGTKLDGSTAVGNQDSAEPRPFNDGGSITYTKRTSQIQQSQAQINRSTHQVQQRDEQLQISTNTLQQQTTQLQTRTGQLQASTSQLQQVSRQLQTRTIPLNRVSTQLQTRTKFLQTQTTQLQMRTSSLQRQTSQLQTRTLNLQRQISQLQTRTQTLQRATGQVQQRTSSNSGVTFGAWSNVSSCQWDTSGSSRKQCQYVWGSFADTASSCTVNFGTSSANGTTWNTGTDCRYSTPTAWAATSSCSAASDTTGPTYSVITARECQTVVTSAFADTGSTCTVTTTPDGSGNTTQCQYGSPTSWSGTASCTASSSSASPYTVTTARECQTVVTSPFANTGSTCTVTTTPDSSGNTTQCQYGAFGAWSGSASCTAAQSTSSPYTVTTATECQSVVTSPFTNTGSTCTVTTTPNSSGNTTQCQYGSAGSWTGTPSCATVAESTSSPYTVTTARECQSVVTGTSTNRSTCTQTSPDGSGNYMSCEYGTPSAWAGTSSCTAQAQSTSNTFAGPARECQTVDTSSYTNVSSCTASSPNSSGNFTACQYTAYTAPADVSSCTTVAQDLSSPHNVGVARQCQYTYSAWAGTSSCTAIAESASSPYTVASTRQCQSAITSAYQNVSSCTTSAIDGSGNSTQCRYTPSNYVNTSSCTAVAGSASSPYTVATEIQCRTTDTGWVGVSSCTAGSSGGLRTTCQSLDTGPTPVSSCTAASAGAGNSWTQTTCNTTVVSAATAVPSCTAVAPTAGNSWVTTSCNTVTTGPTTVTSCTAASPTSTNNYTTVTCSAPTSTGGYSDTLADVAEYYYINDLRDHSLSNCTSGSSGETLCSATESGVNDAYNNVPTTGLDGQSTQHMTTFTLGLGIPGYMQFNPSYASASTGDFYDVKVGSLTNTAAGICPWQTTGQCNWPEPSSNSQANIDDLWHAAVNGRGSYFSAGNPALLITGLSSALAGISTRTGTAAAATTSNPNVTSGDNFLFSSTFTTQSWEGELVRQQLNLTTGEPLTDIDWTAQAQLDAKPLASRVIYTYDAGGTYNRKTFEWANLTSTEKAYFQTPAISGLSQFCAAGVTCLSAADQTLASGENLVNFIRGDRSKEGSIADTTKYYRQRAHLLGDIVNAEAVYVKGSLFNYADLGFSSHASTISSRQGMVYVAANDGMLHAFYAADSTGISGGDEAWAYIPSPMLPKLYKLSDKNYQNLHEYFVDGTPVVADVCVSSCGTGSAIWKTILVGGFNGGGRGYYAIDITTPSTPKVLWEFTNTNLGYSYGNPKITKLKNGTWVVLVTSGYNNVSPGDGVGRLFVLNANTGALISTINSGTTPGIISTGYGDATSPSGLGKIAVRVVDPTTDNTAVEVYSGDMYGNVWRFDVNNDVGAAGYDAHLLAVLKDDSGNRQPITAKPEVGSVDDVKVVFVGTGRYLGNSDLSDRSQQSFYAIKDAEDTTTFDTPRTPANLFVEQVLTNTTCPAGSSASVCTTGELVRTGTKNTVDFSSQNGWYIDFPDSGERDNTDPTLALATLGFNTNVPSSTACNIGGYSYRYFLDFRTGAPISTANNVVSSKLGNALATRPVYVRLPNDTVVDLTRLSDGTTKTSKPPIGNASGTTRRTSWRELITE